MNSPDYRMQEQLEEQRFTEIIGALLRVQRHKHSDDDVLMLASELGLREQLKRRIENEQIKPN